MGWVMCPKCRSEYAIREHNDFTTRTYCLDCNYAQEIPLENSPYVMTTKEYNEMLRKNHTKPHLRWLV